jgi:hypothetical protein
LGLLLLGGQLMSIGFLAELFIAYHTSDSHSYSISDRTAGAPPPPSQPPASPPP